MPLSRVRVIIVDLLTSKDVVDVVHMVARECSCKVVVGEDILSLAERHCLEEGCENTLVIATGRPSVHRIWREHGFLKVLDLGSCRNLESIADTVKDKCCYGSTNPNSLCFLESGPGWLEL